MPPLMTKHPEEAIVALLTVPPETTMLPPLLTVVSVALPPLETYMLPPLLTVVSVALPPFRMNIESRNSVSPLLVLPLDTIISSYMMERPFRLDSKQPRPCGRGSFCFISVCQSYNSIRFIRLQVRFPFFCYFGKPLFSADSRSARRKPLDSAAFVVYSIAKNRRKEHAE